MSWQFWKKKEDDAFGSASAYSAPKLGLETGDQSGLDLSANFQPPSQGLAPMPQLGTYGQSPSSFAFDAGTQQPQPNGHVFTPADERHSSHEDHAMELIAARLDTIKAQLETLNNRLSSIEQRMAQPPAQPPKDNRRPWY